MNIDLGNGIFLDLETGETREAEKRIEERRKDKETSTRYVMLFRDNRRKEERRKRERTIPAREEIMYFLKRYGYYSY